MSWVTTPEYNIIISGIPETGESLTDMHEIPGRATLGGYEPQNGYEPLMPEDVQTPVYHIPITPNFGNKKV
jgi:hypothetical protein